MTGRYDIVLYNNKLHYHLKINRNITILRGDSASGKSELIRLLSAHNGNPSSSGITLICDRECIVLTEGNWRLLTGSYTERIFFIDEGIDSGDILGQQEYVIEDTDYENIYSILYTYSIDEIYGLKESDSSEKYHVPKRVYNEMYRIFGSIPKMPDTPDVVVTED